MGLDMYVYAANKSEVSVDEKLVVQGEVTNLTELQYWRKHPNLHGWFGKLWAERLGTRAVGDFNCEYVVLTEADLLQLRSDIKSGVLPDTSGFFFGSSPTKSDESYSEQLQEDLQFVDNALRYLSVNSDKLLLYFSWW